MGAANEVRTHDPQLGKLMLYQLSYCRKKVCKFRIYFIIIAIYSSSFTNKIASAFSPGLVDLIL